MSVKRYEWVACDEHSCHCDVVESVEGDMVGYEDYAALKAKCAALAAENAGLKAAIETHKHGFVRCNCCGDELMCHTDDVCRALYETPATDSFLAEVRAQESAPLVRALTVIANSEQHDGETVVCDFDTLISVAAGALRDHYAAQIRKGVQS
ncbi:hypothetical protein ACUV78_002927 [Enterobacter kobei]